MLLEMVLAAAAAAALPGWLEGCWLAEDGARWTEECWTPPRAGQMMGTNRSGEGARLTGWETMQIEAGADVGGERAKLSFFASPGGAARTAFAWQPDAVGPGVTFVNTATDYPQRIRYWREGARLHAEIALADGGAARRWTFRRMAAGGK